MPRSEIRKTLEEQLLPTSLPSQPFSSLFFLTALVLRLPFHSLFLPCPCHLISAPRKSCAPHFRRLGAASTPLGIIPSQSRQNGRKINTRSAGNEPPLPPVHGGCPLPRLDGESIIDRSYVSRSRVCFFL